jgi:biotin carboxyl carrier protein
MSQPTTLSLTMDGTPCRIRISPRPDESPSYEYATESGTWQPLAVSMTPTSAGTLSLVSPDGVSLVAQLETTPEGSFVVLGGQRYAFAVHDPRSLSSRRGGLDLQAGPVTLKSPMPGRIVRILQPAGSPVEAKQGILMVEAMKMQNELKSPKAGTVESILVAEGETVAAGQALAVIR